MYKASITLMLLLCLTACSHQDLITRVEQGETPLPPALHKADLQPLNLLNFEQNSGLIAYLNEVQAANKNLKSITKTVQAVELEAAVIASQRLPEVELTTHSQRQKLAENEITDEKYQTSHLLSLNSSWALDIWGKLADEIQASELSIEKEHFNLNQAQNMLDAEAATHWIALWFAQQEHYLIQKQLQHGQALLDIQKAKYVDGLIEYDDYASESLNLSSVQSVLSQNLLQKKQLEHRLNILRGKVAETHFEIKATEFPAPVALIPDSFDSTYLADRPDIQVAYTRLQIMDAQTHSAYKALLPQFSISASFNKGGETLRNALSGELIWQLVGEIIQPLYNGHRLRNQAKQQSVLAEAALFDYEQVVLKATEEVANSLSAEHSLFQEWIEAQKRQAIHLKLRESQKLSYLDGRASVQEYLHAQQAYLNSQLSSMSAQKSLLENRISLALSLGQPLIIRGNK